MAWKLINVEEPQAGEIVDYDYIEDMTAKLGHKIFPVRDIKIYADYYSNYTCNGEAFYLVEDRWLPVVIQHERLWNSGRADCYDMNSGQKLNFIRYKLDDGITTIWYIEFLAADGSTILEDSDFIDLEFNPEQR